MIQHLPSLFRFMLLIHVSTLCTIRIVNKSQHTFKDGFFVLTNRMLRLNQFTCIVSSQIWSILKKLHAKKVKRQATRDANNIKKSHSFSQFIMCVVWNQPAHITLILYGVQLTKYYGAKKIISLLNPRKIIYPKTLGDYILQLRVILS